MAHRVMTLLKMALRELRAGKGIVGSAKALMLSHDWSVTKDTFWDTSRRFVKYCGVGFAEVECWDLCPSLCSEAQNQALKA